MVLSKDSFAERCGSRQSGLLGLLLAARFFKDPLVCLPAGLSTIVMTLSGFGLVVYWGAADRRRPRPVAAATPRIAACPACLALIVLATVLYHYRRLQRRCRSWQERMSRDRDRMS